MPEQDRVGEDLEMVDIVENGDYTATTFACLCNAGKKEEDPLKDKDQKEFLVASLAGISSSPSPGLQVTIIIIANNFQFFFYGLEIIALQERRWIFVCSCNLVGWERLQCLKFF